MAYSGAPAGSAVQPCPRVQGALTVLVLHADDGRPFGNVKVKVEGPSPGSGTTDGTHGVSAFDPVKPGRYTAQATLPGSIEKDYEPPVKGEGSVAPDGHGLITIRVQKKKVVVPPPPVVHWIEFQVVFDDDGEPVSGVPLILVGPDGSKSRKSTDSRGAVRLDDVKRGTFEVQTELENLNRAGSLAFVGIGAGPTSEPAAVPVKPPAGGWRLMNVELYKVKKGDSIASLAGRCRIPWQDLARLNFGTDKPTQINRHLVDDVGCTKKTADGNNYMFDDSDNPGLMLLPSEFRRTGFAVGQIHLLRVAPLPPIMPRAFSL